jgi:hypothetical protein
MAYFKWMLRELKENLLKYEKVVAETKKMLRGAHRESWNRYVSNTENDVHGRQVTAYRMRDLNQQQKKKKRLQRI